MHYARMMRVKDPILAAEARRCADPPRRKRKERGVSKPPKTDVTDQEAVPPVEQPQVSNIAAGQETYTHEQMLEEVMSTATDLCGALGMQTIRGCDTRWFVNPQNGKAVELTNHGLVYRAELKRIPS
jgi:hypothetical protein